MKTSETLEAIIKGRISSLLKESEILDSYIVEQSKKIDESYKEFNLKFNKEDAVYEDIEPDVEKNIAVARDHSLASMDVTSLWAAIVELVRVAGLSGIDLGLSDDVLDKISKVKNFMAMNFEIIDGKPILRENSNIKSMFDFRVEEEKKRLKEHFNK